MFRATPSPSPTFGRSSPAPRSTSRTSAPSPAPSGGPLRGSVLPQVPSRSSASSLPALDFSHQGVTDLLQLLSLEPRSGLAIGTNGSHQVASLQRKQAERARAAADAEAAEARRSDRFNFGSSGPVKATGASSLWGGRGANAGGGHSGTPASAPVSVIPDAIAGSVAGPEGAETGDGLIIVRAGEQAYAFNPDAPVGVDPMVAASTKSGGGQKHGKQQAARTVSEHELLFRSLYMQHLAQRGAAQSSAAQALSSITVAAAGATAAEDLRSVELLSAPYAAGRAYYRAQHLVLANNGLTSLPVASLCCVLCGLLLPALDAIIAGFFTCLRGPDPDADEPETLTVTSRLPPLLQTSRASVLAAAPTAIASEHRRTFLRFITTLDLSFNSIETIDVDPLWPRATSRAQSYLDTPSDSDSADEDGIHHSDASPLHSRFNANACKAADELRRQRQERTRQAPIVALRRTVGKALDRAKAPKAGDMHGRLIAALPAPTPLEVVLATGAPLAGWSGTRAWTSAEMQELAARGPALSCASAIPPRRSQRGAGGGGGRVAQEGTVDPDVPFGALRSLVTLHLHSNRLRSYREVLKLAPIVQRSLQHLTWHGNEAIDAVKWEAHASAMVAFPNLKTLNFTLVQRDFNAK